MTLAVTHSKEAFLFGKFFFKNDTGSVRGSPNGTIGNFTNGTIGSQWYHWLINGTIGSANGTIGITIGTNGKTNGTIGRTLNEIGIPLVPLVEP